MPTTPAPIERFVRDLDLLLARKLAEPDLLPGAGRLLGALIATDDWLPDAYAAPDPERYTQYLLYRDPAARFSLVSFVWGPGQSTPIHDHTVWGLVGVLRGAELSQRYRVSADGSPVAIGPVERLEAGRIDAVSPSLGDVHRVENAFDDQVSISIHLYGADIGKVRRSVYPPEGGRKAFVSGYSNTEAAPPFVLDAADKAA